MRKRKQESKKLSLAEMKWFRASVLVSGGVAAFPSSEDPFTAAPKIAKGALVCSKALFDGVELTSYDEIVTAAYEPPANEACWEQTIAVLDSV